MQTNSTPYKKTVAPKVTQLKNSFPVLNAMLETIFINELKTIYWAEKHLLKQLPKTTKGATSPQLKSAIINHFVQTKLHCQRLEEVFALFEKKPSVKRCEAMEGLIKEAQAIVEKTKVGTAARDVGLIHAVQKIEHYEIASYGGLVQLAKKLGYEDRAEIMLLTLNEEKKAAAELTEIAENYINY